MMIEVISKAQLGLTSKLLLRLWTGRTEKLRSRSEEDRRTGTEYAKNMKIKSLQFILKTIKSSQFKSKFLFYLLIRKNDPLPGRILFFPLTGSINFRVRYPKRAS